MTAETSRRPWMLVGQLILYLATALFLGWTLIEGWQEVADFAWRWSPIHLLTAALILLVCPTGQGMAWSWLARRTGASIGVADGTRAYLLAHLARYIPGGVWPLAQMAVTARASGASPVLFSGLLLVVQVSVAAACALLALPLLPDLLGLSTGPVAAILSILLVLAVLTGPWLLKFTLAWLAGFSAFAPLRAAEERLPTALHFRLFLALLALQVLSSCAFVVFVAGQFEVGFGQALLLVAVWNAAWLGGHLAIPVPMGLGVRESLLALMLGQSIPVALGAAIALLYRLFTVATELVLLVLAGSVGGRRGRAND